MLLDTASGRELRCFDGLTFTGYAVDIALAPGAERFAILLLQDDYQDYQIAIIHAQSGQVERTIPITRPPEDRRAALRFLADNRLLFSNGEDN